MAAKVECPECLAPVGGNDFQCTQCGLRLSPQQASGEYVITEPAIVRALLSPPQRTRPLEIPRPPPPQATPHDLATARFTVPMDTHTVPHLRAGLDAAPQPLHPVEAHIASFIDGDHAVPELARAAPAATARAAARNRTRLGGGLPPARRPAGGERKEAKRGLFARLMGREG
ncbi:hypothetical protein [Comamonas sp. JC664]|uniref:hypothetical protein n=1 Tax=Comamonas sp. JC664 TaxID=2801917 RepID=UPI00191E8CA5|nr:hypothetical protein [Comamonas sp. JC664]MBL0695840.1 hypothetical protein [Comamonas sp. JC664]GHG63782.1 hypothetical protein GCM10012319_03670 [Comamonas sp. KCTC 72670]